MKTYVVHDSALSGGGYYLIGEPVMGKSGNPFFVPDFASEFRLRAALAVRIERVGKSITAKFAKRYFTVAAPAILISASDLLKRLRGEALPWTPAVSFDRNCIIGTFEPFDDIFSKGVWHMEVADGDSVIVKDIPVDPDFNPEKAIENLSKSTTLKTGDLLLFPLGDESDPLHPDEEIRILSGDSDESLLELRIR